MDSGITVTGTGQASAPADLLHLSLSVGCDAADVAAAVEAVSARTDAVTAALRGCGLAAEDISTSRVGVYRQHDPYGKAPLDAYRADHALTVRTTDLEGFGRLLDAAVGAAGNDLGIGQLAFDVADKTALLAEAREASIADARHKAEHYAALAGRELGALEAVTESIGGPGPIGRDVGVPLSMAPELALAPGSQVVAVATTVRWAWA